VLLVTSISRLFASAIVLELFDICPRIWRNIRPRLRALSGGFAIAVGRHVEWRCIQHKALTQ
jgi:hypothetical protein